MLIYFLLTLSEVNVYFNKSVDTTYMDTVPANGNVTLDKKLCERISKAQYSIDFCFYDFGRTNYRDSITSIIVDSLIAAKNRGVRIRVITDSENMEDSCVQTLVDSGIQVINDRRSSLMHDKFAIFDARDTISDNGWVWTGSYNITDYGTLSNSNDAIEIQDDSLALAYTLEFEEMWGDTGDFPDTINGNFGTAKFSDPDWHPSSHFILGPYENYDLYFSPSKSSYPESSQVAILNAVATADHSIYFCIFAFSRQALCDTMKNKWDSGVMVRGVFDATYWNQNWSKSLDMRGLWNTDSTNNPWSPPAPVYLDSVQAPLGYKKLHHKYMIIDAEYEYSDPIVITGSANWSKSGCCSNDENILIIHSYRIANQYLQHFIARYTEAGGTYVEPGVEEGFFADAQNDRLEAHPNPFIQFTVISFQLSENRKLKTDNYSLRIYDLAGRLIKSKVGTRHGVSLHVQIGKELKPGVYFLKVQGYKPLKIIKLQ